MLLLRWLRIVGLWLSEENKQGYTGGLTISSRTPMIRTMMLRKPKNALNAPSTVVLVAV